MRELNDWRTRLVEDVVRPVGEMAKSVHTLSISYNVQAEALTHMSDDIREAKNEIGKMRDELYLRGGRN